MANITFKEIRRHGTGASSTAAPSATPASVTATTIRFRNGYDGAQSASTDDPLIRPAANVNYSFNKFIDVEINSSPAWTSISSPQLSATGVSSTGELTGNSPGDIFLQYAFQLKSGSFAQADFQESTAGTASVANSQAVGVSGQPNLTTWPGSNSIAYGTLGAFIFADAQYGGTANGSFAVISGNQSSGNPEYLCLNLRMDYTTSSGGSLDAFQLTLTYNEV